ncbi:hypothetical protein ACLMJK_006372 [Lecanora helva]
MILEGKAIAPRRKNIKPLLQSSRFTDASPTTQLGLPEVNWIKLQDPGSFDDQEEAMANNSNILHSFLDTAPLNNLNAPPRLPPSAMAQQQQPQQTNGNGNGNGMNGMPMMAGQQMDVNLLYQKVMELSEVLKENREKTQGIVNGAEDLATRAAANGTNPTLEEANAEISTARIAELERQLAHEQNKSRILLEEQKENIKLIGDYEHSLGEIVKDVREFSFSVKNEKTNIAKHWNGLLQEEKDAHLETRFSLNESNAKVLRCCEMLREAHRLRAEEEDLPVRLIAGLQNEVRAYRSALGLELEKPEDEYGWEILKDVPNGSGEP